MNYPEIRTDYVDCTETEIVIDKIEIFRGNYEDFFQNHMLANKPCIIPDITKGWNCVRNWVTEDGYPNYEYLKKKYGSLLVPVANCDEKYYDSQRKSTMTFNAFLDYWKDYTGNKHPSHERCLYLKDWHFTLDNPHEIVYEIPTIFSSDWLNEWFQQKDTNSDKKDDYKFVYMGPKNSWTPFHADVFSSFSWSANICGEKRWLLLPPGEEKKLTDANGNLPYDACFLDDGNNGSLLGFARVIAGVVCYVVVQKAGEGVFIPSGWHHQVWNTEDTISINHNWINGCNVGKVLKAMESSLEAVEREIAHLRDCMDDWSQHCQLLLKSCFGLDHSELANFVRFIINGRLRDDCPFGENHARFDIKMARKTLEILLGNFVTVEEE